MTGFDDIKGIGKGKDIVKIEETSFEKLMKITGSMLSNDYWFLYPKIKRKIKDEVTFDFNESDLKTLASTYNKLLDEDGILIFEDIMSVLLKTYLSNQKKQAKEKRFKLENLDYDHNLFSGVGTLDCLVAKENKINELFCGLIKNKGVVKNAIFIKNESESLLPEIGNGKFDRYSVKNLILYGNETNYCLFDSTATIDLLIASNNNLGVFGGIEYGEHHLLRIKNLVLLDNIIFNQRNISEQVMIENLYCEGNKNIGNSLDKYNLKSSLHINEDKIKRVIDYTRSIDYDDTDKMLSQVKELRKILRRK